MIKTSTGVQELRRRIATKAKAEPSHRFWGLYCHVWKHDVLTAAYYMAKANRGAAGLDNKTFHQIEHEGIGNLVTKLSNELREGQYRPLELRVVKIPKSDGSKRTIKIAAIRDRIVQGALKIVLEPIFEMDFQTGSFGYRPKRSAHQALERVKKGIGQRLTQVIDLDLKSYFDTVKHDLLLGKISKRVDDPDVMRLCNQILKSGGKIGLPQGSIIGPVFSNLFLNDIDKMLEQAQTATRYGPFATICYTRFADDLTILVNGSIGSRRKKWLEKVMLRLEEELDKLNLSINREKTKVVDLERGNSFNFLGYTFRLSSRSKSGTRFVDMRPMRSKRTELLRSVSEKLRRNRFRPVEEVVKTHLNPMIRGWVNYFRAGNSARDLRCVSWQVECKVRRFATRQTPKKRGGRRWTKWSHMEIYDKWGLYSDYRTLWAVKSSSQVP